jgi:ferredoxin
MKAKLPPNPIKASTREFIREARQTKDYSLFDFVHGYVYARWPYLYIGIGTGEHRTARILKPVFSRISRWLDTLRAGNSSDGQRPDSAAGQTGDRVTFADTYHGKVVPLASARKLVTVNEEIELPDLEKVLPYKRARDIILRNPDHIAVLECPCRSSRQQPCLPLDVCLIVGEPFASFVIEHHPKKARMISQAEAVDILEAENQRGHVHHAFFKDAMLGRFYAICNCCSCCCGAMQAHRNGTPMLASSGYVSQVDPDLCAGCSDCTQYCQFGAITVFSSCAIIDQDICMGCGVCVELCPNGAVSLVRDSSRGEPLEIFDLMEEAASG